MSGLGLLVTDASPLITLSAADSLDCLTLPRLPVVIPDMVYFEVTEHVAKLGADEIVAWSRRHRGAVLIAPTRVFTEFQALRATNPRTRSKGRGEQAALEVLNAAIAEDDGLAAVLIYEDADLRKRRFVRGLPDRVISLSTGDLLRELEHAGRIQSADHVLDVAAGAGRNVEALRTPEGAEDARAALRAVLGRE